MQIESPPAVETLQKQQQRWPDVLAIMWVYLIVLYYYLGFKQIFWKAVTLRIKPVY
jgi:hypothetical protein